MVDYDRTARCALAILDSRRRRKAYLSSDLFGEAAWDALLHLFVADAEGRKITGWELASASDSNPSVLSRWLALLSAMNLILAGSGPIMDRALVLSPAGFEALEGYLEETLRVCSDLDAGLTERR